jgi:hypothetical protein
MQPNCGNKMIKAMQLNGKTVMMAKVMLLNGSNLHLVMVKSN